MNLRGRGFIAGFAVFQIFLLACAGSASAVKPLSPLSADCSTLSSAGMVYKVRCVIKDVAGTPPESVVAAPIADKAVSATDVRAPQGVGLGEWFLTIEFTAKKAIVIPFEARYSGATLRVGAGYDPFNISARSAPTPKGTTVKNKDGSTLREYPSK
jgi:hypothetical protein